MTCTLFSVRVALLAAGLPVLEKPAAWFTRTEIPRNPGASQDMIDEPKSEVPQLRSVAWRAGVGGALGAFAFLIYMGDPIVELHYQTGKVERS